jgi:hypothetical protein
VVGLVAEFDGIDKGVDLGSWVGLHIPVVKVGDSFDQSKTVWEVDENKSWKRNGKICILEYKPLNFVFWNTNVLQNTKLREGKRCMVMFVGDSCPVLTKGKVAQEHPSAIGEVAGPVGGRVESN